MSHPLIITCAITGAETSVDRVPHLPVTPEQQALSAEEAVKAGASIIHLHVREDDGKPSQRVERFKQSIDAIRARVPEVIIQISTGGAVGESIDNRLKPLSLKPEMASLNCGTLNFGDEVFMNHPKDIVGLAEKMKAFGVMPELEIYEAGMLESAFNYAKKGILNDPLHFQFVLGVPGGMSGDPRNLNHLVSFLSEKHHWGVAGVGRFQLPLSIQAIAMGGHVRVGFEDNIYFKKGEVARSNAQFVERLVRLSGDLGRELATPLVARKMLGIS